MPPLPGHRRIADARPERAGPEQAPERRRRAGIRRRRRLAAGLALLAPTLSILAADLARRAGHVARFDTLHALGYAGSLLVSAAVWSALLYVASSRRGVIRAVVSAAFVLAFTIATGIQGASYSIYRVYLSRDGQASADTFALAVSGALPLTRPVVVLHLAAALLLALAFLAAARRFVVVRQIRPMFRPALAAVALVIVVEVPVSYRSFQSTSPELIYFHGLSTYLSQRAEALLAPRPAAGSARPPLAELVRRAEGRVELRTPEPVPPLARAPARPRNVLLLLQESQRADVTCIAYDPGCKLATSASNATSPRRLPLLQVRANTSTTAIALSNLWAGVDPTESKKQLLSAPLAWDYAHAAGYDTAYWTSQHLMFRNARTYLRDIPAPHRVSGTELADRPDILVGADDALLTDHVIAKLGALREPFFGVVHYSNIHGPRKFDPVRAPFQPTASAYDGPDRLRDLNHYKNAVHLSDLAVARLIEHVHASEIGERTVILYTSDHGEAFEEHGRRGHTLSTYDEEVRVPAWIDAPPGTLSPAEERNIAAARTAFVFQLDLAATLLDLLGIWDDAGFAPFRARMPGHPLTRAERTADPIPITNVSHISETPFPNWGMMQGSLKVVASEGSRPYRCYDVLEDPRESVDLALDPRAPGCEPLLTRTRAFYRVLPSEMGLADETPEWARR